jgi:nicotinamide mononucleotide (NMN) deamidase PncC
MIDEASDIKPNCSPCFWQGYIVYSVKKKLKSEYIGLSGNEIKNLKASGVEVSLKYCMYHSMISQIYI